MCAKIRRYFVVYILGFGVNLQMLFCYQRLMAGFTKITYNPKDDFILYKCNYVFKSTKNVIENKSM